MRRHSASLFWTSNVGSATALDRFDQRRPTSTARPAAPATKIRRLSISYLTLPWAFTWLWTAAASWDAQNPERTSAHRPMQTLVRSGVASGRGVGNVANLHCLN